MTAIVIQDLAKSRKTVVTTRSYEVTIITPNADPQKGFCPGCAAIVRSLDLDSAVTFADTTARELLARISAGKVHSYENSAGLLRICLDSLLTGMATKPADREAGAE